MTDRNQTPLAVKALAVILGLFSLFAFTGSVLIWGEGFILDPPPDVDLTYPIADLVVHIPAAIIAALGLWQMRAYGYAAAYFVAGFYTYASVEIFVHVFQEGPPYALEILIPQILAVLVAIALVVYLWRIRDRFTR
ncbi:MAG: hypothetical protein JXB35_18590 [Anaerolineae bacterium]|nr:hypothetical protein [Anaerolineae bacterium]